MPALPIMGAVAAGHLLDLISVQTARCCTFPLLRSPSPVETSPASTSFLVSMVAKSSPLASSFKRGCAAGPPCLRRPRGSRPRPTHREDLLAPTGALEQRAAKSLVCAGVLVRSCRAHSTLLHARSTLLLAFRSYRVERVRELAAGIAIGIHTPSVNQAEKQARKRNAFRHANRSFQTRLPDTALGVELVSIAAR